MIMWYMSVQIFTFVYFHSPHTMHLFHLLLYSHVYFPTRWIQFHLKSYFISEHFCHISHIIFFTYHIYSHITHIGNGYEFSLRCLGVQMAFWHKMKKTYRLKSRACVFWVVANIFSRCFSPRFHWHTKMHAFSWETQNWPHTKHS